MRKIILLLIFACSADWISSVWNLLFMGGVEGGFSAMFVGPGGVILILSASKMALIGLAYPTIKIRFMPVLLASISVVFLVVTVWNVVLV